MAQVYAPKRCQQRETPQIQRFCELLRGARPQQNLVMRKRMNRGVTLLEQQASNNQGNVDLLNQVTQLKG